MATGDDSLCVASEDVTVIPFNYEDKMEVQSWLKYFDKICEESGKNENWKLKNFQKYLRGSALNVYIQNCHSINKFEDVEKLLQENFYRPELTSFGEFSALKFKLNEDITQYFRSKLECGKKLNLSTEIIMEGLTDGLPLELKSLMLVNEPQDPLAWLNQASKLVKIRANTQINPNPRFETPSVPMYQNRPRFDHFRPAFSGASSRPAYPRQVMPNSMFQRQIAPTPRFHHPRFSSHHVQDANNFPNTPCQMCTQNMIPNAFHWHNQCPFRSGNNFSSHSVSYPNRLAIKDRSEDSNSS